jgi:Protein of unknown function (DUF2510)
MIIHSLVPVAAADCTKSTTGDAVVGLVFFLAVVGAVIALAVANGQARRRLAMANAELNYLRPEYARLRQWRDGISGTSADPGASTGYETSSAAPAQWYPDPSRRHELRYWNGAAWTGDVADQGVTSTDPVG